MRKNIAYKQFVVITTTAGVQSPVDFESTEIDTERKVLVLFKHSSDESNVDYRPGLDQVLAGAPTVLEPKYNEQLDPRDVLEDFLLGATLKPSERFYRLIGESIENTRFCASATGQLNPAASSSRAFIPETKMKFLKQDLLVHNGSSYGVYHFHLEGDLVVDEWKGAKAHYIYPDKLSITDIHAGERTLTKALLIHAISRILAAT